MPQPQLQALLVAAQLPALAAERPHSLSPNLAPPPFFQHRSSSSSPWRRASPAWPTRTTPRRELSCGCCGCSGRTWGPQPVALSAATLAAARPSARLRTPLPGLPRPCSFYFWMDVIATLSILIDIPAIIDPVINGVSRAG